MVKSDRVMFMLTEKEKMQRARMYMWKLKNGIDPISNRQIGDDSVLSNERLRRCFQYVFDVLGRDIEVTDAKEKNDDHKIRKKKKAGKAKFYITPEEVSRITLDGDTCVISDFVEALNNAVNDSGRKKLLARNINDWLVYKGYLRNSEDDKGKVRRELSERSGEIGISSKKGLGAYGVYTIILYGSEARQFILDNIDEIVEFAEGDN